jgi:hypothetical protein
MGANGGWATSFLGDGASGEVTATSPVHGFIINDLRNNCILLGSLRHECWMTAPVRSLIQTPAVADTYEDHDHYLDTPPLDWDHLINGDLTWVVRVYFECLCENAGTSVTPRVVLAGTSTVIATGAAHSGTGWAEQYVDIPASTGQKQYRVQIKRSNLNFGVRVMARLRLYAPEPVA